MLYLIQQYLSQFLHAIENAIAALYGAASGGDSAAQDPSIPPAGDIIGTVDDGHGLLINVYGEQTDAGVNMTVKVMEGVADLRGFFMDVGDSVAGVSVDGVARQDVAIGNEAVTSVGARDNNMTGTGEKFDVGVEIGTAGTGRDDISQANFTVEGVTLEQLDGLTFGVRATSVGEDRDEGVKLVSEFNITEPQAEEPPADPETPPTDPSAETPPEPPVEPPAPPPSIGGNFPDLMDNITSLVLYYNAPAGDTNGDDIYAVKVENVAQIVADDLDLWLIDATDFLQTKDANIGVNTELLGVAITHSDGTSTATDYYAMDNNTAGQDIAPTSDLTGDTSVDYNSIMDLL